MFFKGKSLKKNTDKTFTKSERLAFWDFFSQKVLMCYWENTINQVFNTQILVFLKVMGDYDFDLSQCSLENVKSK